MSAFDICLDVKYDKVREITVFSEKYGLNLSMSANRCDIVADDQANKFTWISRSGDDEDTFENASMLFSLCDNEVEIMFYMNDFFGCSTVYTKVDPEEFKQLLRDVLAALDAYEEQQRLKAAAAMLELEKQKLRDTVAAMSELEKQKLRDTVAALEEHEKQKLRDTAAALEAHEATAKHATI